MLLFMNKQKKSLIIHPFLLSIFPIIALFSSNVRELSFQEMFLPMVLILSFTTGIWILLRYILKNGRMLVLPLHGFLLRSYKANDRSPGQLD